MSARPHATTIVGVRRDGVVAIGGDGQVTVGDVVMKHRAAKVRRLHRDTVLAGFAGAVADALTLFDKFEQQLDRHQGLLLRASVGLAKEWRTDRYLRHLEAMLIVANADQLLLLSGDGEIIEPDDDLAAIGSGGPYALAAAKALLQNTELDAAEVVRRSLAIAASLCIYTNHEITVMTLPAGHTAEPPPAGGETITEAAAPRGEDPESAPAAAPATAEEPGPG